ncbi:MAG TPA: c-type cytochrome [Baekduia sp.]|uniref:cytochrome bc1 complex diheme cytochrome c subunit n=1 Tax=Baekduia sp. TaxID=2600305 RepID=UPI002D785986|nr:c-type cytochrome [Baekduia sp.]HET6506064.1 c-type cytochrome [Baekduia sp.]
MTARRRLLRRALFALGLACLGLGTVAMTVTPPASRAQPSAASATSADVARGRDLFVSGCSACHGMDAGGISQRGPNLRGVGALAADFYLRTGRMPLAHPGDEPVRAHSVYSRADQAALVAYIATFGGPPIPTVDPRAGSVAEGQALFTDNCAGCHQVAGRGGIVTPNVIAPSLARDTKPIDVAEAVRIGPYVMPVFSHRQLTAAQVDDLARYVQHIQALPNDGGWGIGNIGPIPEGLVLWGLGIGVLVVTARIVGERTE